MTDKKKEFQLQTQKGYDFFQVTSAFQKCIRRNMEDEALYWTMEMLNSGYDKYIWKRLLIIATEDIGIADPMMQVKINSLRESYYFVKENKARPGEINLFVAHAVIILCRAEKSRLFDYTKNWMAQRHETLNLEIPDFALDAHTRVGKMKGRGVKHFHEEGAVVSPHSPVDKEKERKDWHYDWHVNKTESERQALSKYKYVEGKIFKEGENSQQTLGI
jgi:replication-associated recombination protein RarA